MAINTVISINIPDLDIVVTSDADLRSWVTSSLSEMIIARLKALKDSAAEVEALKTRAIAIDDPKLPTRGITMTMGAIGSF